MSLSADNEVLRPQISNGTHLLVKLSALFGKRDDGSLWYLFSGSCQLSDVHMVADTTCCEELYLHTTLLTTSSISKLGPVCITTVVTVCTISNMGSVYLTKQTQTTLLTPNTINKLETGYLTKQTTLLTASTISKLGPLYLTKQTTLLTINTISNLELVYLSKMTTY